MVKNPLIWGNPRNPPIYEAVCRDMGFNPLPYLLTDTLYESELDHMRAWRAYYMASLRVIDPTGPFKIIISGV